MIYWVENPCFTVENGILTRIREFSRFIISVGMEELAKDLILVTTKRV